MEITPGIYIGKATENGGLVLVLVMEAGRISAPIDTIQSLPFSESGFCSQEEVERYYKQAVCA